MLFRSVDKALAGFPLKSPPDYTTLVSERMEFSGWSGKCGSLAGCLVALRFSFARPI